MTTLLPTLALGPAAAREAVPNRRRDGHRRVRKRPLAYSVQATHAGEKPVYGRDSMANVRVSGGPDPECTLGVLPWATYAASAGRACRSPLHLAPERRLGV
jgi:hypothetical protein